MHVYKHLNINSKYAPLESRRRTIKRKTYRIRKDDSVWTYWLRLHARSIPDNVFICMYRQIISSEICIDSLVHMDKPNVAIETAAKPASVDINNMPTSIFRFVIIRIWT